MNDEIKPTFADDIKDEQVVKARRKFWGLINQLELWLESGIGILGGVVLTTA